MTTTTVLAALCGALLTTGGVLLARCLVAGRGAGSGGHGGPPAWVRVAAGRLWHGSGRTVAERRRHRLALAATVFTGAGAWLLTGLPVFGLVAAAAVPGVPWLLAAGRAERRAVARVEAVGEWTRRLRDVAETGAGLQAAIVSSVATAPRPVATQVGLLGARLQAGGDAQQALRRFADDIGDPVGDQIVAALLLHLRDRGDRLGVVLSSIADATAKEVGMRKEADAERASARFAVRFMTGFSVVAVLAAALSGDYLQPYGDGFGQLLMVVLVAAFVGLLGWARMLSRPAATARLLAPAESAR